MADEEEKLPPTSASSSGQDSTSPSSGDELSVYSMRFDPLKALQEGKKMLQRLPFPKTRRLDNLNQYKKVANAGEPLDFETNMMNAIKKRPLSRKSNKYVDPNEEPSTSSIERRFLPHQMPTSVPKKELDNNNLLKRINNITGPLAKLREYRDKRIRLCIKTRNLYGGLNEFIAYVIAFDKHWNLALEDVSETFTRKRRRKVPVQLGSAPESVLGEEELLRRGLVVPVVERRVGKKLELCRRHLPQLMLRGEHVVIITPAL